MENQVENNEKINVKGIILLSGIIFGVLISLICSGSFLGGVAGAVAGLIVAVIFISVGLPHKPHDR